MQNILNLIDILLKNKKSEVISFYGHNGVGKTTICKKINEYFCSYNVHEEKEELLAKNSIAKVGQFNMVHSNGKLYEALYLNDYTMNNSGLLLSKILNNNLLGFSFSYKLSFSAMNFTNNKIHKELYKKIYNFYDIHLPKNNLIFDKKHFNLEHLFFYNTTGINSKSQELMIGHNSVENLAIVIEYTSSVLKLSVNDLLQIIRKHLNQPNKLEQEIKNQFRKYVREKKETTTYSKGYGDLFDFQNELLVLLKNSNFYLLCDPLYKKLLNLFITFNLSENKFNKIQKNTHHNFQITLETYKKYNNLIESNFKEANKIITTYFSSDLDISLIKKYNASIGIELLSLSIKLNNKTVSLFNYLNNFASESEKKIINLIHLTIKLMSLDKDKKHLISADDFIDSFDHSHYTAIFELLAFLLRKKQYVLVNFTHNYDIFKLFNALMKREKDDKYIYLITKKNSPLNYELTNFTIKFDYYVDYLYKKSEDPDIEKTLISLIAAIPHYRNIVEINESEKTKSAKYILATNLMHYKEDNSMYIPYIMNDNIFSQFINGNDKNISAFCVKNKKYSELLDLLYSYIISNKLNLNLLENRIFIAIYSRIYIEKFIVVNLNSDLINNPITKFQTGVLIKMFSEYMNMKTEIVINVYNNINKLYSYIKSYIHTSHYDIGYLIGLDMKELIQALDKLKNSIIVFNKHFHK